MVDVYKYLNRIDYSGPLDNTYESLARLQKYHIKAVPFENLDVHFGYPITLNVNKLYSKIVKDQRGGFCYEVNGLFHSLLKKLGFDSYIISARVFDEKSRSYSPEFDHLAILVDLCKTKYLVDVGFGDFIYHPLEIESHEIQEDPNGLFRIKKDQSEYIVESKPSSEWKLEYKFKPEKRRLSEFHDRCIFHQTSKESHVTSKRICSLAIKDGRMTLTDNKFKITKKGSVSEAKVSGEEEFQTLLKKYFGISVKAKG